MFLVFSILLGGFIDVNALHAAKAYCPKSEDCNWTYPHYVTQNLQCTSKYQCPVGFLCCPDCHYQHYVCKSAIWLPEDQCPKDRKLCTRPLDYAKTKYHKCVSHAQCYETDHCCPDNCYTHKVCKSITKHPRNPQHVCPISIRRKSCPNTNRILNKYSCEEDDDCSPGYICCNDNCYDHMVCKFPNDAFAYQSIYRPSNYTTPASFEQQYKCPEVKEKCLTPYSLRLAKKFICFKDEDCKVGQLCCKDACVKEFRICTNLFTLEPQIYQTTDSNELSVKEKEWSSQNFGKISTTNGKQNQTKSPMPTIESISKENSAVSQFHPTKSSNSMVENALIKYLPHLNKGKDISVENIEDNEVYVNNKDDHFYFIEDNLSKEGSGFGSGASSEFQDEED